MAFDQSTIKTGFAVIDNNKLREYGLIDLSIKEYKEWDSGFRSRVMVMKIREIVQRIKPDIVVIEDISMQRNAKAVILLGRVQGGIIACCDAYKIPVDILAPSTWRKLCGFKQYHLKRADLKILAMEKIKQDFALDVSNDEADAICIGMAEMKHIGGNKING